MAIEKQDEVRIYTRTIAQVKAALGIGAGETLNTIALDDGGVQIQTLEGTNPQQVRWYRISLIDARSLLGMANAEQFDTVQMDPAVAVTVISRKRIV